MARGTLICAVLFSGALTLAGCATNQRSVATSTVNGPHVECPTAPVDVTIQASPVKNGKATGFFIDMPNFGKLVTSLKQQKDYRDKMVAQARAGGCQ
jgi:hypothetical protein